MHTAVPWQALVEAWQAGYDHAMHLVNTAADDVTNTPVRLPAPVPYEQRVAERLAQMERHAGKQGRREWLGLERGDRVTPW